ncbi:MAG: RAMP superfamily CRISPR-associated protein, partial [Pseudomonadota bacterium]
MTAPFRFVPLSDTVAKVQDAPAPHNVPDPERMSAVIDVDWQVETPLLIGEATASDGRESVVEPFKLGDRYAIPGATLRGAMRAIVETVSMGRLFQMNRHARYALRDFEHPSYKKFVEAGLGSPGLQAGWLQQINGHPHITPCDWAYVPISALVGSSDPSTTSKWAHKDRSQKYRDRGILWRGTEAFRETARMSDIGEHQNKRLFKPDPNGGRPGYLICSGAVPGAKIVNKKYEYAFFDKSSDPRPISDKAWDVFETSNCKPSQNKRKPDGSWEEFYKTYEQGGRVPVFYVGDLDNTHEDPHFSFGLTRLYRIPHDRSLGQVLLKGNPAHRLSKLIGDTWVPEPDFPDILFGHVFEPQDIDGERNPKEDRTGYVPPNEVARKGRVSFDFAFPTGTSRFALWPENGPVETIMGPPKPSFAPFYLEGTEKDYSTGAGDLKLAGRKRYLPRHKA